MRKGLSDVAVEGVLRRKVQDWLASIEDKDLANYLKDKIVVAGGSIASLMMGEPVNDFDIYFTCRDASIRAAYYYLSRFVKNPSRSYRKCGAKMWVEVIASNTEFGHRGKVVQVDENGVMRLKGHTRNEPDEFVDGPGCPRHDKDWPQEGRANIVVKSAGGAGGDAEREAAEGADPEQAQKYQYFEMVPDTTAATTYAQDITEGLGNDEEIRLAAQLCDTDTPARKDIESENAGVTMARLAEEFVSNEIPPKAAGPKALNKYRPVFLSSNAVTLTDGVQLIIRFTGAPAEIIKNFDFVHTTCYWQSGKNEEGQPGKLNINIPAVRSMMSRKLKYVGSRYPLCSLVRTRKFVDRGWSAPASVFIKAMWQCKQLDWNNLVTWQDQLTGMDAAYFTEILNILARDKKAGKSVDGTYVVELIDRMM